jgi:hypothetical protein
MSALKNFERSYKFNPFDFMKKLNADYFGEIKNRIFTTLVADVVKEEYDVEADETFFKLLVESYQEAGERFPQNQKVQYGDILLDLEITPLNPNVPKSKGIIEDFKEIVSDDDLRPSMTGVYFDDGFMVGTDAHVLIKDYSPNEFTKKYNKKIIDAKVYIKSKGEVVNIIEEKYPEYDRVIPTSGFKHRINVDLYELFNIGRSAAFYLKLVDANNLSLRLKIKGEKFAVNPILLADVTEYFLKKGSTTAELKYTALNRAIVMDFGGSTGLIMPVVNYEDKDRDIIDTLTYDLQELDAFKGSGKPTGQRKPTTKTRKPKESKPESREEETRSQDFRKYTGKFAGENEYISRRDIEKIILKDNTILETNDFIDGVYRSKKKFDDGGSLAKEFIWTFDVSFSHAKKNQPKVMGRHWVSVSATTEKGALREAEKQVRKLYQGHIFSNITPILVSKETYEESMEAERKSREKFGFSNGGNVGQDYSVYLYYGGAGKDKIYKGVSLEKARELVMGAEHAEIIDNEGNNIFVQGGYFDGGGKVNKTKNFRKIERIDYMGKDKNLKEEKYKVLVVNPNAEKTNPSISAVYFNVFAENEQHARAAAKYLYSKKYDVPQEQLAIEAVFPYAFLNRFQIKNQYEGHSAEEIWNTMDFNQRRHFLSDHYIIAEIKPEDIVDISYMTWAELNESPLRGASVSAFQEHVQMGQYEDGGEFGGGEFGGGGMLENYDVTIVFPSKSTRQGWVTNDVLHLKVSAKNRGEAKKKAMAEFEKLHQGVNGKITTITPEKSPFGVNFDDAILAKGGMTEHGLRVGDKIIGGKIIGTTIRVRNENRDEDARVDLNTGKRTILDYDAKTKKYVERKADGGEFGGGGNITHDYKESDYNKSIKGTYYSVVTFANEDENDIDNDETETIAFDNLKEALELDEERDEALKTMYPIRYVTEFETNQPPFAYEIGIIVDGKKIPQWRKGKNLIKFKDGGDFGNGGSIARGNYEMALSKAKEIQHHALELKDALKKEKDIEAWVVSKVERASSDLSDVTHYLDGKSEYAGGGEFGGGGIVATKLAKELKRIQGKYFTSFEKYSDKDIYDAWMIYKDLANSGLKYSVLEIAREISNNTRINLRDSSELVLVFRDNFSNLLKVTSKKVVRRKYGLGGFIAGAVVGAGATYLLSDDNKTPNKEVAKVESKSKAVKSYNLTAEQKDYLQLLYAIQKDGFNYAIVSYSDYKGIKNPQFVSARNQYKKSVKDLENYIEKVSPDDTAFALDKEGIEYGFLEKDGYNDWKDVKDAKFQTLLSKARASYEKLYTFISKKFGITDFSEDSIFDAIDKIDPNRIYKRGGMVGKNLKRIVRKGTKYGKLAVKKAKPTAKRIVKKAKIGFKALANKVAKAYEGKAVKPKYQSEYGKRYSKAEAQEVGNKVAAKVKRLKGM